MFITEAPTATVKILSNGGGGVDTVDEHEIKPGLIRVDDIETHNITNRNWYDGDYVESELFAQSPRGPCQGMVESNTH